jgi:hypothetical protein
VDVAEIAVAIVAPAAVVVVAEVADLVLAAAVVALVAAGEIAAAGKHQQEQERATVRRGFRFLRLIESRRIHI